MSLAPLGKLISFASEEKIGIPWTGKGSRNKTNDNINFAFNFYNCSVTTKMYRKNVRIPRQNNP